MLSDPLERAGHMSEPRLIKRYANRKLYDTARSSYITLDEIAALIKEGEEIQIVDNRTKEDLTAVTMAQILVEEQKRQKRSALPNLRELIQQSGELFTRTTRSITEPVTQVRTSFEESVGRFIKSGEERVEETRELIKGWVDHQTHALDELQRGVDDRVRVITNGLNVIGRLQRELKHVKRRLDRIEAHLSLPPLERRSSSTAAPGPVVDEESA